MMANFRIQLTTSDSNNWDYENSSFTETLSSAIALGTNYEAAIIRLIYPASVINVQDFRFAFFSHTQNLLFVQIVPDGAYTANQIADYLNNIFKIAGEASFYDIQNNESDKNFSLRMSQPNGSKKNSIVEFSKNFADMLGFTQDVSTVNGIVISECYDMRGSHAIMHVCMNSVELTHVGSHSIQLLDSILFDGLNGKQRQQVFEPIKPSYSVVKSRYIQSLTLSFLNTQRKPFRFTGKGFISAIIEFRPVDYDFESD